MFAGDNKLFGLRRRPLARACQGVQSHGVTVSSKTSKPYHINCTCGIARKTEQFQQLRTVRYFLFSWSHNVALLGASSPESFSPCALPMSPTSEIKGDLWWDGQFIPRLTGGIQWEMAITHTLINLSKALRDQSAQTEQKTSSLTTREVNSDRRRNDSFQKMLAFVECSLN